MSQIIKGIFLIVLLVASPASVFSQEETAEGESIVGLQEGFDKLPTYIKSDNLNLKSKERVFVYTGNVEVKQGDMTLTSDMLEGTYDENNRIKQLVAKQNVVILKGEIRAHGEKATYDAATEIVVLTENPELQQNGSVLTADLIKIFLKENRSSAEGAVRVKLVNEESEKEKGKSNDLRTMMKAG